MNISLHSYIIYQFIYFKFYFYVLWIFLVRHDFMKSRQTQQHSAQIQMVGDCWNGNLCGQRKYQHFKDILCREQTALMSTFLKVSFELHVSVLSLREQTSKLCFGSIGGGGGESEKKENWGVVFFSSLIMQ